MAPPSDYEITRSPAPDDPSGRYIAVERRPLALVAVASAQGLTSPELRAFTQKAADALDTCIVEESRGREMERGAARAELRIGPNGELSPIRLTFDPGSAKIGLLCFVSPMRLLAFEASRNPHRTIVIEGLWGGDGAPQ